MKPILNKENLPNFLIVSNDLINKSYNQYLLLPFKKGEVVKVAPFEEQKPSERLPESVGWFKLRYLKVYRKNEISGKFDIPYVESWNSFEVLKKKNHD